MHKVYKFLKMMEKYKYLEPKFSQNMKRIFKPHPASPCAAVPTKSHVFP